MEEKLPFPDDEFDVVTHVGVFSPVIFQTEEQENLIREITEYSH
jgi:ubiquinone/menaquinone biosynthesis C-methylase UbiE